ncbi:hypothetical protein THAOC_27791, partial [Thalassiosira oceanica]
CVGPVATVRPQTTIDASSVVDLSAPMCSQPSHEQFFRSRVSLLQAADVTGNLISRIWTAPPPGGGDGPGEGAARFTMMSSVEMAMAATPEFNDSVGRSLIFPSEALEGGERLTMAILAVSADSNKSQQCLVD